MNAFMCPTLQPADTVEKNFDQNLFVLIPWIPGLTFFLI